ncbi:hypothetical protein JTB14_028633 [Gonioctena quinquepunctata]|nr:hypothetical protein JTB14_028633 [Gonioctena quinquepunctata]
MDKGKQEKEPPDKDESGKSQTLQDEKEGSAPPTEEVPDQEVKYELGQDDQVFGIENENTNNYGKKPRVLVTDEKPENLEQESPDSPLIPNFTDCDSTLGTPLVSPSKCTQGVHIFLVGGGKPIYSQMPLEEESAGFISNIENTSIILTSNIVIEETKNIIVEVNDRMEQPLGPSEADTAAEEGDTVLSQSNGNVNEQ